VRTISHYRPQPKRKPKRLPRRRPIKAIPSGIGDEGIVGNWLFYYLKGGDHLHDFSPYDNHGTINGAKFVDGRYGWSLNFDGVDDYVNVPHASELDLSTFTVSVWVNADVLGTNYERMVDKSAVTGAIGEGYRISFDDSGNFMFILSDGTSITTSATADEWFYLVGVYDGSTMYFYKNGSLVDSKSASLTISETDVMFGSDSAPSEIHYLDGTIAIVRIYSIVKSGSWISRRFEETRSIFGI